MPSPKKAAAQGNSAPKKPAAVQDAPELPKPDDAAEKLSSYPAGVQVYSYQPQGGGEPILLALDGFESPDKVWHFDVAQLPILSQTWKWMERAKIPKHIQRQACALPDTEYFKMFDEWFDVMRKLRGAGPKGAVTTGK